MAKTEGRKSFLDFFKMKDLDDDEFDDDLFDDDDDDDEEYIPRSKKASAASQSSFQSAARATGAASKPAYSASATGSSYKPQQSSYQSAKANNKLVEFNSNRPHSSDYRGRSEVYVIKPQDINEAQTVTDFLKGGKTIVINMEGVELAPAQRIIDFIGGACYALDGTLQAISANIFIAAPNNIEVTGDLREEILNESTVSPELGRY